MNKPSWCKTNDLVEVSRDELKTLSTAFEEPIQVIGVPKTYNGPLIDKHYIRIKSAKAIVTFAYFDSFDRLGENETLYNANPNCNHEIVSGAGGSGIRCRKCGGWFCY